MRMLFSPPSSKFTHETAQATRALSGQCGSGGLRAVAAEVARVSGLRSPRLPRRRIFCAPFHSTVLPNAAQVLPFPRSA